jgi:hypothetical protein
LKFFRQGTNMQNNNIDEGLFFADRHSKKLWGKTKDEALDKAQEFMSTYKDYKPKASKVQTDKLGRFFVEISYQKREQGDEETLGNKASKGIAKGKELFGKAREVVKKVSDSMPRQGTLSGSTGFELGQKQASFVKAHPDVKFGAKYKNRDGSWSVDYSAKPTQTTQVKKADPKDRINNIQRALNKLSDKQLQSIEDIIK